MISSLKEAVKAGLSLDRAELRKQAERRQWELDKSEAERAQTQEQLASARSQVQQLQAELEQARSSNAARDLAIREEELALKKAEFEATLRRGEREADELRLKRTALRWTIFAGTIAGVAWLLKPFYGPWVKASVLGKTASGALAVGSIVMIMVLSHHDKPVTGTHAGQSLSDTPARGRASEGTAVSSAVASQPSPAETARNSQTRSPASPTDSMSIDRNGDVLISIGGVDARLKLIKSGSFMMGSPDDDNEADDSERPQHEVTLTKNFWLGATEVTQALWKAVMGDNPSQFKGEQRPVERVSWNDAQAFIQKINVRVPEIGARLPTEAEWECAARAGTLETRYGELDAIAWYGGNSERETHPVGRKQANSWGLYDMLGNVYEWTGDIFSDYQSEAVADPSHRVAGAIRVFRGGSWLDDAGYCRAACRDRHEPDFRYDDLGLRLARGPKPE